MTPQEEHWRQIFLDAYENNTGDARRLALNETWFDLAKSDDYSRIGFGDHLHAYWTALVDAAHVEQEQTLENFRNYHHVLCHITEEQARELKQMEPTGYVGSIVALNNPGQGIGGSTDLVAKMQEFLTKEGESVDPYQEARLKKWINYFGGMPKKDES